MLNKEYKKKVMSIKSLERDCSVYVCIKYTILIYILSNRTYFDKY